MSFEKSIKVVQGPTKQHVEAGVERHVRFGGHEIRNAPYQLECGTWEMRAYPIGVIHEKA